MANTVVPTSPAAGIPENGVFSTTPAAAISTGATTQPGAATSAISSGATLTQSSSVAGSGVVSAGGGDPLPSSTANEIGWAMQPVASWQPAADIFNAGQSDIWGPASSATWSAALGAGDSATDYNLASTDTFMADSSMGDTLWYDPSAGTMDGSQIAGAQSTTDFGDQSPSAGGSFVTASGGAAQWPTG